MTSNLRNISTKMIFLLALIVFLAPSILPAQEITDPTASQTPSPSLQVPPEQMPPKSKTSAPVLLISGLVGTIGGAVLCIYAVQFKDGYTNAYNAWSANPTSGNLAARDATGVQYLLPFIGGLALSATGIVLTLVGISNGMGADSYQPIVPVIDKEAKVSTGLYFFIAPTSLGIALK